MHIIGVRCVFASSILTCAAPSLVSCRIEKTIFYGVVINLRKREVEGLGCLWQKNLAKQSLLPENLHLLGVTCVFV